MVGKDAKAQCSVGKTLMQGTLHGGKLYVIPPVLEDSLDTVCLLGTVTTDIDGVAILLVLLE